MERRKYDLEFKRIAVNLLYEYIEIFYNRRRRISSLGYLSPAVYATKIAA